MGWTYTDLNRCRKTLAQAKADHEREAVNYGGNTKAEMIAREWHDKTFYAIIRLTFATPDKAPKTFLRIDLLDNTNGQFGYKDMTEDMGVYVDNAPSEKFAKLIYKYIPRFYNYTSGIYGLYKSNATY
jgi:hypothetical protein